MSFSPDLNFVYKEDYSDGYTSTRKLIPVAYNKHINDLKSKVCMKHYSKLCSMIESEVIFRFFKKSKYILIADVDSRFGVQAASRHLKTVHGIESFVITSSGVLSDLNTRYWLIGMYVGTFKEIYEILSTTPGVDSNWLEACKRDKSFCLRAFPKLVDNPTNETRAVCPNFSYSDQINFSVGSFDELCQMQNSFNGVDDKTFSFWKNFIINLRSYWHSSDMVMVCDEINRQYKEEINSLSNAQFNELRIKLHEEQQQQKLIEKIKEEEENKLTVEAEKKTLHLRFNDAIFSQLEL